MFERNDGRKETKSKYIYIIYVYIRLNVKTKLYEQMKGFFR